MESIHQLYAVLGIAGGWFTHLGFSNYMHTQQKELELKSEEKLKELSIDEQAAYLETINKTVQALKEVALNPTLQKAINQPKQELSSMLQDNETLVINDNISHKITNDSVSNFDYTPPQVPDIEEELEDIYTVSNYFFTSQEKYFKLDGISKNANSLSMPVAKRIELLSKAEKQEPVKLKLKIIRDGISTKIKQVFILDYIR